MCFILGLYCVYERWWYYPSHRIHPQTSRWYDACMTVAHLHFQPLNTRSPASWPSHSRPAWSGWFWWGRCSAFWCPFKANTHHSQRMHCFIYNQLMRKQSFCGSLFTCAGRRLYGCERRPRRSDISTTRPPVNDSRSCEQGSYRNCRMEFLDFLLD